MTAYRHSDVTVVADVGKSNDALILPVILAPSMFLEMPELSRYQAANNPARNS